MIVLHSLTIDRKAFEPWTDLVELRTDVFLDSLHRFTQLLSNRLTLKTLNVKRINASGKDKKRNHCDVRTSFLQKQ